ncbi:MAG: glucosaminidase domain-containing protein [Bacteroidales bacterium]|nr:glucosaminidase domain-containing protein [Bacteroidales bacterium]
MKRIISFLTLFLSICTLASAQNAKMSREEYIEKYAKLAVQEMHRTGIPASITLAQACLESSNGNSELSVASNNHFGIKCHSSWQGKRIYHDDDAKGECFRVYNEVYDSYIDHSNFLRNGQRYAFLFEFDKNDFTSWAYGLKKAGYATNPEYPKLLIKIIEDFQLYKYDSMTPEQFKEKTRQEKEAEVVVKTKAPSSSVEPPTPWTNESVATKGEKKIYKNNGKKFVILEKNETIYSISRRFSIPMWKLYAFNDFKAGETIPEGSVVYIEQKALRTEKKYETHTVREGETFYSISQLYGVKANRLAKLNKATPENSLEKGTNIYVRKYAFKTE